MQYGLILHLFILQDWFSGGNDGHYFSNFIEFIPKKLGYFNSILKLTDLILY